MKTDEHQKQEKVRGFWSKFWAGPYPSRSDPRAMPLLAILAVGVMIFGGPKGLGAGCLLLWYLSTMLTPAFWEPSCQRFGSILGAIIALTPIWLPFVVLLSARWWRPLFGIH
jgi:hypothetical protein